MVLVAKTVSNLVTFERARLEILCESTVNKVGISLALDGRMARKIHVWLVDDDYSVREELGQALRDENFQGVAAADAGGSGLKGYNVYHNGAFLRQMLPPGTEDPDSVKYSLNGAHIWSKGFIGPPEDAGQSICVDASGNVLVTGYFYAAVNFGGMTLISAGLEIFLAKFDSSGSHLWSKRFGGTLANAGPVVGRSLEANPRRHLLKHMNRQRLTKESCPEVGDQIALKPRENKWHSACERQCSI